MVFVSRTGITCTFHEVLAFYIIFSQTVDYDMHMDVAAFVMPVHVCTDESLVARKVFAGIF